MATTNEPVIAVEETVVPTVDRAFVSSPIGWSSILAATAITLGNFNLLVREVTRDGPNEFDFAIP